MYAKWCITLGNSKPTMFNCTWAIAGQARGRFFLGASLKGYNAPVSIGPWASVVKEARFSLVNDAAMAHSGYTMNDCPERRTRKVDRIWELRRDVSVYPHTEVGLPRGILFERRS